MWAAYLSQSSRGQTAKPELASPVLSGARVGGRTLLAHTWTAAQDVRCLKLDVLRLDPQRWRLEVYTPPLLRMPDEIYKQAKAPAMHHFDLRF